MSEDTEPKPSGKPMMGFRGSRSNTPRLVPEQARRQGKIATLAFQLLGGREGAMAFLNTADETLGARPIDLAIANDEGYARVEQALRTIAGAN